MNTQVNWKKIRDELQRFADVDKLKSEVQRIGTEIRNFDFHSVLSPAAQAKVKNFEKRYSELMRTIQSAQRQMDREFNRILRQIKAHRSDVGKVVDQQKTKLEKVSRQMRKRFTKKAAGPVRTAGNPSSRKKKTTTRKRRKA
jgi:hypothetical protein